MNRYFYINIRATELVSILSLDLYINIRAKELNLNTIIYINIGSTELVSILSLYFTSILN